MSGAGLAGPCRLRRYVAASRESVRTVYTEGSGTRPKCAGVTTILRTSASRTVTGTSQRTGTTTSAFVVPGMRSAASAVLRPAGGSRFPLRRFRESQLRFRAVDPDAGVDGVKQQSDPGFLVASRRTSTRVSHRLGPPKNMKARNANRYLATTALLTTDPPGPRSHGRHLTLINACERPRGPPHKR